MDLGDIPNLAFAKIGQRGKCNIMFPAVYLEGLGVRGHISKSLCVRFYEEVLHPSLVALDNEHMAHWFPTYAAAERAMRDKRGQYRFSTVEWPAFLMIDLVHQIREHAAHIREFRGMFFYHEKKGIKGGSVHDPNDENEIKDAFDEVTACYDLNNMTTAEQHQWYVDVGIEVRQPKHVVQWNTMHHHSILRNVLRGCSDADLAVLSRTSGRDVDFNGQLYDFAGFRKSLGRRGAESGVVYVNVYTTDKTVHDQRYHSGVFDKLTPKDTLPGDMNVTVDSINQWTASFADCINTEDRPPQEGTARCEVRVRIDKYDQHFVDWEDDFINQLVSAVPAVTWW